MRTRPKSDRPGQPEIQHGKGLWQGRLLLFQSIPSTNQWALDHVRRCRDGDLIQAIAQTSGRGRLGRTWTAPAGGCLTVSVVLAAPRHRTHAANLGQAAALAVQRTLADFSIKAQLKWPNDVMANSQKIAGTLAEQAPGGAEIVLGIGLNVNVTAAEFRRSGLGGIATSMSLRCRHRLPLATVLNALRRHLEQALDALATEGPARILGDWKAHDALAGRQIALATATGIHRGQYAGLAPDGRLRLIAETGGERLFWSGDATVIPDSNG